MTILIMTDIEGCAGTDLRGLEQFFWGVTHQIARNHRTSGWRVPSKIVPAITEVSEAEWQSAIF